MGRVSGTIPGLVLLTPTDSQSYLAAAVEFYRGARELAGNSRVLISCAFLAAQSLECALKSFLVHRGLPATELSKRPYGHDLECCWKKAALLGLSVPVPQWCLTLNEGHKKFLYRYPMGLHGQSLPNQQEMLAGLKTLIGEIQEQVCVTRSFDIDQ